MRPAWCFDDKLEDDDDDSSRSTLTYDRLLPDCDKSLSSTTPIRTDSNNCPTCRSMLFDLKKAVSLEDLESTSRLACSLCTIILEAVRQFFPIEASRMYQLDQYYMKEGRRRRHMQHWNCKTGKLECVEEDYPDVVVTIRIEPAPADKGFLDKRTLIDVWGDKQSSDQTVQIYSSCADTVCQNPVCFAFGRSSHVPQYSGSKECLDILASWIAKCQTDHPNCMKNREVVLPSRVLSLSEQLVRVMETYGKTGTYLALSHCWGSHVSGLRLTKSTLRELEAGFDHRVLCKTFRDAISCALRLSVPYIWIDSLCIMQDDKADWEREAARMGDIYRNSYVTLCATRAKDGNDGLFSNRWEERKEIYSGSVSGNGSARWEEAARSFGTERLPLGYPYEIKPCKPSAHEPTVFARLTYGHHQMDDPTNPSHHFNGPRLPPKLTDPLTHRAWTLQERLLASRTIHFRCDEMTWECNHSQSCECTEADRRDLWSWRKWFASVCNPNENVMNPEEALATWNNLVTRYSRVLMTYESDKLVALSGLATEVSKRMESKYIGGLWERGLPLQLLWYIQSTDDQPNFHSYHVSTRPEQYRAPSWSWASVTDGLVRWTAESTRTPSLNRWRITSDVLNVTCTQDSLNPFGNCGTASITILGYLTAATVSQETFHEGSHVIKHSQDGLVAQFIPDTDIKDPKCPDFIGKGSTVYCVEIASTFVGTSGLVLSAFPESSPEYGKYRRIGHYHRNEQHAKKREVLKPRWRVDPMSTREIKYMGLDTWYDYEADKQMITII